MTISTDVFSRVVATVFCLLLTFGTAQTAPTQGNPTLADSVTPQGVRAHMAALQRVADTHGGNRAAGTPGYAASVRYAERTLRAAGFAVRRQPFTVTLTETLAETGRTVGQGVGGTSLEPNIMAGSPNTAAGGFTAPLALPADSRFCAAETGSKLRGAVVLIERGSCTFAEKSQNAAAAGAVAALIYNDEQDGFPLFGSLGDVPKAEAVPTAGLSQRTGEALIESLKRETVRVGLELRTSRATKRTANVIAELPGTAEGSSVVMVGAHLDSVAEGPGINDNGSGVGLVLELARGLAQKGQAEGVRFALWGGEELGLLGSEHYVSSLSPAELEDIRAYLNFDMLSSPNAAPFVYGDSALTELFTETFTAQGLTLLPDAVGGRSDHAPFETAGVPVAGLFSGAEGLKSGAEVRRYRGDAAPYDACYHRACDTLRGSSTPTATRYLDLMADAAAEALEHLTSQRPAE